MTLRIKEWADEHDAAFFPVHPVHETVLGVRCYPTIADVPGDIDLAVILTGRAVESFEEVVARRARFAVIFAAGFSEAGADGEALEARLRELVRDGATHLLGPNTNLNAFSDFRDDLPGPSIALITQSGHQGRPDLPGPGARHRRVALGADGQRGRPRVRRLRPLLRRPARGRRRRRLHRGLQGRPVPHARRRPRGAGSASRSSS